MVFTEKQKINGLWIALIPVTLLVFFATYKESETIFRNWQSTLTLIGILFMMISFIILLFKMEITTTFTEEYIQVQYFPFNLKPKTIYWNNLKSFETRNADSFKEFWGWGWGYRGTKKNRAYTTYGDFGLQLTFKNGNRLFIGSQKKDEMEELIDRIKKHQLKYSRMN
jgi:hypothetical protein